MAGKNFNYFLLDDSSKGRVKCTLANWTGVAYRIPRIDLEKCKDRPDLQQSGVYFLFGIDETTGGSVVYVGQADVRKNGNGLLGRLFEHRNNSEKDYWTEAVVFTTKDKENWLGATEISWLESHFCTLAKSANRYVIKNGNEPSPGKPTEEKISDLEEFVKYATIVMGVLNHRVFEPIAENRYSEPETESETANNPLLYCTASDTNAKGQVTSEGFVVFAGGKTRFEISQHCREHVKRLRDKHASKLDANGILTQDILFDSPSGAASFLVGQSTNGLTTWKTAEGKTLKDIENKEEAQ